MRQARFVKINHERWKAFEEIQAKKIKTSPDELGDLFIQLTDDLAYAQTHYPNSEVTEYLNALTGQAHQEIYRNRRESWDRFVQFWITELPLMFYRGRKAVLWSFILFAISVAIGVISTDQDENFSRLVLGDGYVNMTLENIKKGDPMGVYKDEDMLSMFIGIAYNNIRVSLYVFAMGLLTSVGSGYILFKNGVMLGTFQYFFHQHNLLLESASSIWIHGTLEICGIILVGAASMVMGSSILFPGTYSRLESFRRGALTGAKMLMGLIPVFIVAAFLEGYVTRLTEWPLWAKLVVIGASALFIIWYFIIYPFQLGKHADRIQED